MEQHEKIGSIEAISLFFIAMVNTVTLNIPNNILQYTGTSSCVNIIYVTFFSVFFCLFIYRLYKPLEYEDIIDISNYVGGSLLKWIIGFSYIIMFLGVSSLLLKYLSECLILICFPTTPILYILGFFVFASIFATMRGFSGIIRNNLILFPFLFFSIILIFVSTYKHFIWQRLFPILGQGFNQTFIGGLSNIFVFNGLANLYFLMPLLKEKKDFKKLSITGVFVSGLYLFLSVISLTLAFTYETTSRQMMFIYPLARLIEYGRFFQRIDAFFILFWILAAFSYISTNVMFSLIIFKKMTFIKSTKALAPCFSVIVLGFSLCIGSMADFKFFTDVIHKYYTIILIFIISPIIYIIANLKKKRQVNSN